MTDLKTENGPEFGPFRGRTGTFRARWIVPAEAPPIENGFVSFAEGRIVSIGSAARDVDGPAPIVDLGPVAILPGLVNAHTHLEFSGLEAPLAAPRTPFPEWIRRVIDFRRARDAEPNRAERERAAAIRRGLVEAGQSGTRWVGEIATPGWPAAEFDGTSPGTVVVFLELLGLAPDRLPQLVQFAREHLAAAQRPGAVWRAGLSPHAPYTVHPELLAEACRLSAAEHVPLAMHLAETFAELELLASASGELVEFLRELGAWNPSVLPRGLRPLDYLQQLALADRSLVIHGNYLTSDEIAFVAQQPQMSIIYCPRTCDYFGHRDYPLRKLLDAGVHVALGTDSRASNPNLNLFEEMQFVMRRHPDVRPEEILKLGTVSGARALGCDGGDVIVGQPARFLLVELPGDDSGNLAERILVHGQIVH